MHKYNYQWKLSQLPVPTRGKVFSCFACGGGSSMGYKLAGFDVVGCNEIDPRMAAVYKKILAPNTYTLKIFGNLLQGKIIPLNFTN